MKIALLGCGLMGTPIAHRLLTAGHHLTVWNRTPAKASALEHAGAQRADSPAEAATHADVVITMLTDGSAVHQVLFEHGVDRAMPSQAIHIDMSSILPEDARAHAAKLAKRNIASLDAPVSGGTLGAEQGTLAIMAGGDRVTYEAALPLLSSLGTPTHVGPSGSGQLAKLANQMIVGITIGAVAEALLMVERGGADPAQVRRALRGGFAESRILEVHGQRMIDGDFAKRGSVAVQLKDLVNALHTASGLRFDAPITQALATLYSDAAQHGDADLDQSALYRELARRQRQ